jgi:nucleoid DNA-binding protein
VNKTELVKRIARESKITHSPLTQAQVRQALDALFTALTEELSQPGGRVEIEHFAVLESRLVKNSSSGWLISKDGVTRIPPKDRLVVTCRIAKRFKKNIRVK